MNPRHYDKDLQKIIKHYLVGKATDEELLFIEQYYAYLEKNENPNAFLQDKNFEAVLVKIANPKRDSKQIYYRFAIAAILLLSVISVALYYSVGSHSNLKQDVMVRSIPLDILPGTSKAVLTLSNGSKVILGESGDTNISDKNGLKILNTSKGQLIYTISYENKLRKTSVAYNTVTTPKGGQYQVVLPDGSKVWLNAASSLTYPEIFVGKNRKVKLTGEAYFEVAKNRSMPFIVTTEAQHVEVLGTHFNINSYLDNSSVKTTLLEGRIKVSCKESVEILKPGDQAIANARNSRAITILHGVDLEDETAWKNGQFRFNNADLKSILKQLERWYDIKIDYNNMPQKRFNGIVPRTANLSQVISMLEVTGNIKFKIEENRELSVTRK